MKIRYYILIFLLVCSNLLFADDIKFTASVSKREVGTGEQFEVMFSVNANADNFSPPSFNGFQILSGPNVSTSIESINGRSSVSNAYSYILMATKEGQFTIGPATLVINGRKLTSNALTIKVVKGRTVPQNNSAQTGPDNSINDSRSTDLSKSLFIKAVVDKTKVYEGQQVIVSYRLYTRVGIEDSQADKLPDLTGFWSEDIKKQQQQVQWRVETYKGQRYNVADIKQSILFPQHSGNLTIDPLAMTFIVRQEVAGTDIMDQVFGGGSYREVKFKAQSVPVIIHAMPLPETGKPAGFAGAVGDFKIEATVDKSDLKANEALNYKVKITGSGNIKLFKPLSVNFPPDFEKYDPKITDSVAESESGVSGSRIYNYLLIPRHEGDYTIDPVKFSYFNPATGRYYTLGTTPFKIKVEKGAAEANVTAFSAGDKQDIRLLNKDIRYIKPNPGDLVRAGDRFFWSAGYFLLVLFGPVICAGAFVYRNRVRKNNSDIVKVKSRRAGKIAAKHLANAGHQLTAKNTKAFYEDIFKGLYGYLSDKLNIPYASLDRDNISSELKARAVDSNLIKELIDTLDLCEMARYAPVSHISEQQVFDKAKGIINQIENEI